MGDTYIQAEAASLLSVREGDATEMCLLWHLEGVVGITARILHTFLVTEICNYEHIP